MTFLQTRKSALFHTWLFLALIPLAMGWQQNKTQVSSAPIAGAMVADLKGKVQVQLPGQAPSTPGRGQILPAETTITTEKGRILLRLEDGSQILVNEHTRLLLKQPSPNSWQRLQLLLGRIKAEIQKHMGGSPPFQIGTPSAVISVRGTRFNVEVDKHSTTKVSVEEGEVQLESAKSMGKPVVIKAGHKSQVKEGSAPELPKEAPEVERRSTNNGNGRDNSLPGFGPHGNGNPPGPRGGGRRP
jgi:hypothetical protein